MKTTTTVNQKKFSSLTPNESILGLEVSGLSSKTYLTSGSPEGVITADIGATALDPTTGTIWAKFASGNTGWSGMVEGMVSQTAGIDGLTSALITLYTVPTGKTFLLTKAMFYCSNISGILTPTFFDIQDNLANILISDLINIVSVNGSYGVNFINPISTPSLAIPAGGTVDINVTAGTGTTVNFDVNLFGILF